MDLVCFKSSESVHEVRERKRAGGRERWHIFFSKKRLKLALGSQRGLFSSGRSQSKGREGGWGRKTVPSREELRRHCSNLETEAQGG